MGLYQSSRKFNPNPMSKLIVLLLLSFTLTMKKSEWASLSLVLVFSAFYILMGRYWEGVKNLSFYLVIEGLMKLGNLGHLPSYLYMFVTIIFIIKMFYLTFMAGGFLIRTSDVGSIISSMDKLRISKNLSIPLATMFRFGPSFKEEYRNIRFAMKMRGISARNPILAMEYIYVPLLSISSEIAEDIARYAETKALSDPREKVRLRPVSFGLVDFIFIGLNLGILLVDKL